MAFQKSECVLREHRQCPVTSLVLVFRRPFAACDAALDALPTAVRAFCVIWPELMRVFETPTRFRSR